MAERRGFFNPCQIRHLFRSEEIGWAAAMHAPLHLYRASREELVTLVLRQRAQIAELERGQARLRART